MSRGGVCQSLYRSLAIGVSAPPETMGACFGRQRRDERVELKAEVIVLGHRAVVIARRAEVLGQGALVRLDGAVEAEARDIFKRA